MRLLFDPVLLLNLVCPSLNPNPISKANPNSASNADHDDFHACILRDSVSGDTTTTSTATTATTTPATTTTPAETSAGGIYALMFWWPWTCWLISFSISTQFIHTITTIGLLQSIVDCRHTTYHTRLHSRQLVLASRRPQKHWGIPKFRGTMCLAKKSSPRIQINPGPR